MSFGNSVLWNSIGSLIYLACNWLTTILVVTLTGNYEASGQLAIAMAVGNVFATIMLFRVRTVQISDIDGRFSSSEYIGFRFISFLIACAFCFVYSVITVEPVNFPIVCSYAIFKAVESFADVFHGIDQKVGRFDIIGISQILRGAAVLGSFSAGIICFDSLFVSINLMSISSLILIIFYDLKQSSQFDSVRPCFSLSATRDLFWTCAPGFFGLLTCTMVISVVRQSFGNEFGSEQLGVYAAIAAPTVIAQALASYVYAPMIVPITKLWIEKNTTQIKRYLIKFVCILMGIIFICVIGSTLFAKQILSVIYGQDIINHLHLLNPLLMSTGATALLYFLQDLLVVFNLYTEVVVSGLISIISAILTKELLFSLAGMNGITFTIILSYGVSITVMLFCVHQALKSVK